MKKSLLGLALALALPSLACAGFDADLIAARDAARRNDIARL